MSFLKREHAPLTPEAWAGIDTAARKVLETSLKVRRVVDVEDPKGWDYSAVGLGRLSLSEASPVDGVAYGIRRVQPLVETRTPFELDIWGLDDISRGAEDFDWTPLEEAARYAATFEDRALLLGLEEAGIEGITRLGAQPALDLELDAPRFLASVGKGMLTLRRASIGGPFALVLGSETFLFVNSAPTGYPLLKQVRALLEGPVLESDLIEGGLLISLRGGDFRLSLGQDLSIGYESHDARTVRLFVTESFTFRALEPKAVVPLRAPG
jgi:uncharacterized linocin/CFP29 family protein